MYEQQISADDDNRACGKRDHSGCQLVNGGGERVLGLRNLLQTRQLEQVIVGRALFSIAEDFVGANDLPELQRSIRIARPQVGVGGFYRPTERGPQTFSIIVRKSTKQIVKRVHPRSRCRISSSPSKFPA